MYLPYPWEYAAVISMVHRCVSRNGLRSLIDKHAPVVTKNVVLRPSAPWITEATRQTKRAKRHAERTWQKCRLIVHLELCRDKRRQHNYLLASERTSYVSTKVAHCRGDSKNLFSLVNSLMGTQTNRAVPNRDSDAVAAAELANFFETKVSQIVSASTPQQTTPVFHPAPHTFSSR